MHLAKIVQTLRNPLDCVFPRAVGQLVHARALAGGCAPVVGEDIADRYANVLACFFPRPRAFVTTFPACIAQLCRGCRLQVASAANWLNRSLRRERALLPRGPTLVDGLRWLLGSFFPGLPQSSMQPCLAFAPPAARPPGF